MYAYFERLFAILNNYDNNIVIMTVYLSCLAFTEFLRIIACSAYRSALLAFRLDAKEIKAKEEIGKLRKGLLRKTAAEYIRVADKNVSRIPTAALIQRQTAVLSLFGWRYTNIMSFVEAVENGFIWIGLILSLLFANYSFVYGVLAVGGFLLIRLTAAFFGFRTVKSLLEDELLIYIEREIGRFFPVDAGGAVLRLKNELNDSINKQSAILKESIEKIGTSLADAMDKKLVNINESLANSVSEWENSLGNSVSHWSASLTEAGKLQNNFNASAEKMEAAGNRIQSSSELLANHFKGHSQALSDHLGSLVSIIESLKESNNQMALGQDAFIKQSRYIEQNQYVLEKTIQSYEISLQNFTQALGEGLGTYISMYSQLAAQSINETLKTGLDKMTQASVKDKGEPEGQVGGVG